MVLRALVGLLLVSPSPVPAADLTVTTTADVVNGDVSSPAALAANPGPDGISLREAIEAANNAPGPHTITFSPSLAGQTLAVTSPLVVTRDGVTLTGLVAPDGQPNITLDGTTNLTAILAVRASDFTMTHVRIIRSSGALTILAGRAHFPPPGPPEVRNIRIEDNVFSNEGLAPFTAWAIRLGMEDPRAANVKMVDVRIGRNTFIGFRHEAGGFPTSNAILVHARGTDNVVEGMAVFENEFIDNSIMVELAPGNGSGSRIAGTRIFRNTVNTGFLGVALNPLFDPAVDSITGATGVTSTSKTVIEDTVISANVFRSLENSPIFILGGLNSTDNVVRNTQIVNNLITGVTRSDTNAISLRGGDVGTGNRVEGVRIVNNTIADNAGAAIEILQNVSGTGNSVAGVTVVNTILWRNGIDFVGPEFPVPGSPPDSVSFSIVSASGFAGANGNIAADPRFVNPGLGDFHLETGSPAIDAGTSEGAPFTDLDCRVRIEAPDIGAFEFGGAAGGCGDLELPALRIMTNQAVYRAGDRIVVRLTTEPDAAAGRWFIIVALVTPVNTPESPFFVFRFDPAVELLPFQAAVARASFGEIAARPLGRVTFEGVTVLDLTLPALPLGGYQWLAALFSEDLSRVSAVVSAEFSFE